MKGYYRYHLFYLTSNVSKCLLKIHANKMDFPIDKEIIDFIDVDAYQVS